MVSAHQTVMTAIPPTIRQAETVTSHPQADGRRGWCLAASRATPYTYPLHRRPARGRLNDDGPAGGAGPSSVRGGRTGGACARALPGLGEADLAGRHLADDRQ